MTDSIAYLLVNFGGPRDLDEITPFLISLLTDKETVRTKLPSLLHDFFFKKIAKKRAKTLRKEYEHMGGGSPIFYDTEWLKEALEKKLDAKVMTYHRFLPATHQLSFEALKRIKEKNIVVFPLYPQFSYATTGSAAKELFRTLPSLVLEKMLWIKSYPLHPCFLSLFKKNIRSFLLENNLRSEETILFFSPHGLPKSFIDNGDPYLIECEQSFSAIKNSFPKALCRLGFQSKFGKGEWLKPYTIDLCNSIKEWGRGRKNVIFIPLSFTSDHIETLVEVERLYLPVVQNQGFKTYRLPAFNRDENWVNTIVEILEQKSYSTTKMLVRSRF